MASPGLQVIPTTGEYPVDTALEAGRGQVEELNRALRLDGVGWLERGIGELPAASEHEAQQ